MTYDYDNAPTDPAHGGKMTAEMAAERIAELEAALRPFAKIAGTYTVQAAAQQEVLLTLSNGERMCGIEAGAFTHARKVLRMEGP